MPFQPVTAKFEVDGTEERKSGGSGLPIKKERVNASEINVVHKDDLLDENHSSITTRESIISEHYLEAEMKSKQRPKKSSISRREKLAADTLAEELRVVDAGDSSQNVSTAKATRSIEEENMYCSYDSTRDPKSSLGDPPNGSHSRDDTVENIDFSDTLVFRFLNSLVLSAWKTSTQWLERSRHLFMISRTVASNVLHYVQMKIEDASPIILKWIMHFVNIMLLLFAVWLDCTLRGIDSFLRMGTTSFFSVVWCSVLSIIAMVGMFKCLLVLAVAVVIGLFLGFSISTLLMAISGIFLLWFYGSFWITMLVIFSGGLAFALGRERLALLIATSYSVYCVWTYVGWLGLFLDLNLSCISSEVLILFLRNCMKEQRRANGPAEQTFGAQDQSDFFSGETLHASSAESVDAGVRSPGVPSTSGSDSETTSEDEVIRLLNCSDHYATLGLSHFENVDTSVLKREYKKKAMLVHPDKNMGNENSAEAFKKLQNAYEVLLDSYKRKLYDDELRREELLNYFRRFQEASEKSRRHGFFTPGSACAKSDADGPLGESRRIACRKCGNSHTWVYTRKLKSRARWCQECKDFHPAKDGDGWVEQSSRPLFFGTLQKVDPPAAYVCADSKIYNASEWYICQGMRCSANTHKPSFHVNTSVTSKHNSGREASSGPRGGGMPAPNMEDTMTEEEFFVWLQNAVQSGMFDDLSGNPSESQSPWTGSTSKGGGGGNTKRKKRGKR